MQQIPSAVQKKSIFLSGVSTPLVVLSFFVFASPAKIGNFDFRHFVPNEGLSLSVSRSSPPMAVLEDERLAVVLTEPLKEIKLGKSSKLISAGTTAAWPRLQRYSRLFESKLKGSSAKKYVRVHSRLPFSTEEIPIRAANHISHISELTQLVRYIPAQGTFAPVRVYTVAEGNSQPVETVRSRAEAPLVAPPVVRSLPAGEEAPPIIIPSDKISAATPVQAVAVTAYRTPASAPSVAVVTTPPAPVRPTSAPGLATQAPAVSVASVDTAQVGELSKTSVGADALTDDQATATVGDFRILGQIELGGGLAATGNTTKLEIQWQNGNTTRTGVVDYSTGEFLIEGVPELVGTRVTAKLTDESGYVLGRGEVELDDTVAIQNNTLKGLALPLEAQESLIKGQLVSAYNVGGAVVQLNQAEAFAPAQSHDVADKTGNFRLSGLSGDSTFLLDGFAPDHWGTRVIASGRRRLSVPLFPNKMLESFFNLSGVDDAANPDYGMIWGEIKKRGLGVSGAQVQLAADTTPAIYFNELRIPDRKLTSTTGNGLFAFVKVPPGLQVVQAQYQNQTLPSSVEAVASSMVSYANVSLKAVTLEGQVVDPVAKITLPAQVSVIGTKLSAQATNLGFKLKIPSSDNVIFLEANAGDPYLPSRQVIPKSEARNIQVYAFKKDWLAERLKKTGLTAETAQGVMVGFVQGPAFHVQLDESVDPKRSFAKSDAQVVYFDQAGEVDPARASGLGGGGAFMMTNLSPGLHTVVISSEDGNINTSRLFLAESGVVNALDLNLRP